MGKRRFKRVGMVGALAAGSLALAVPSAQARIGDDYLVSFGLYLDIVLGGQPDFGFGFDVRANTVTQTGTVDGDGLIWGVGAYAQILAISTSGSWRVSVGAHSGFQPSSDDSLALDFELGWIYQGGRRGQPTGHGLQLGIVGDAALLEAAFRYTAISGRDAVAHNGRLGLGIRLAGMFEAKNYIFPSKEYAGRPQRCTSGLVVGRLQTRGGRYKHRDPRRGVARRAAAAQWAGATRAEAASVPAFIALARDLHAAGAPEALASRAMVAASEELRHTQICAAATKRKLGRPITVEVPPLLPPPPDETRLALLTRLAVESWQDGCIGEGIAAADALARANTSRLSHEKQALEIISRDETSHAELGWDILRWATEAGGAEVANAVDAMVKEAAPADVEGGLPGPDQRGSARRKIAITAVAAERWSALRTA